MKRGDKKRAGGKKFKGEVVSDKMTKAVVVLWKKRQPHPFYKRVVTKRKRFYADNQIGAKLGDQVEITECRPLSKLKRFVVTKIIKKS